MAASRNSDGSVVRAGLSHVALSLSVFGMLGAGAVGAAFLFGDEAAGAPRVELALYSEQDGPPPLLKNRSPLEALDANADDHEHSLGVEYEDAALLEDGDEASMTVTEIASNAGTGPKALAHALRRMPLQRRR